MCAISYTKSNCIRIKGIILKRQVFCVSFHPANYLGVKSMFLTSFLADIQHKRVYITHRNMTASLCICVLDVVQKSKSYITYKR